MRSYAPLLEGSEDFSGYAKTLFNAINHHCYGVEIILKTSLTPILGVRHSIANMRRLGVLKSKT